MTFISLKFTEMFEIFSASRDTMFGSCFLSFFTHHSPSQFSNVAAYTDSTHRDLSPVVDIAISMIPLVINNKAPEMKGDFWQPHPLGRTGSVPQWIVPTHGVVGAVQPAFRKKLQCSGGAIGCDPFISWGTTASVILLKKLLKNCVQFFGLCISLKLDFYLPYPLLLKVKIMIFKFNLGINRLS